MISAIDLNLILKEQNQVNVSLNFLRKITHFFLQKTKGALIEFIKAKIFQVEDLAAIEIQGRICTRHFHKRPHHTAKASEESKMAHQCEPQKKL